MVIKVRMGLREVFTKSKIRMYEFESMHIVIYIYIYKYMS